MQLNNNNHGPIHCDFFFFFLKKANYMHRQSAYCILILDARNNWHCVTVE